MKKIGKFLFWLTGFLYTMDGFKRARKNKRLEEAKKKLYDTFSDMGASDTLCRGIWRFVLLIAFLLIWPLWLIQVILDMTVNKDWGYFHGLFIFRIKIHP